MARKRHTAEEIIGHLRTSEIDLVNGSAVPEACRKFGITEQPYYRWEKEYGGPRVDQAKRLKGLEQEHARLRGLVTNLWLDNSILKEVAAGHCQVRPDTEKRCALLKQRSRFPNAGLVE